MHISSNMVVRIYTEYESGQANIIYTNHYQYVSSLAGQSRCRMEAHPEHNQGVCPTRSGTCCKVQILHEASICRIYTKVTAVKIYTWAAGSNWWLCLTAIAIRQLYQGGGTPIDSIDIAARCILSLYTKEGVRSIPYTSINVHVLNSQWLKCKVVNGQSPKNQHSQWSNFQKELVNVLTCSRSWL